MEIEENRFTKLRGIIGELKKLHWELDTRKSRFYLAHCGIGLFNYALLRPRSPIPIQSSRPFFDKLAFLQLVYARVSNAYVRIVRYEYLHSVFLRLLDESVDLAT